MALKVRTGETYSTAILRGISLFLIAGFLTFIAVFFEIVVVVYFATEYPVIELKLSLSEIQQLGIAMILFITFFGISYLTLTKGVSSVLMLVAVIVVGTLVGHIAAILTRTALLGLGQ